MSCPHLEPARRWGGAIPLLFSRAASSRLSPGSPPSARGGGGRLMFRVVSGAGEGGMLVVRHVGSSHVYAAEFICRARVIPCIGTEDEEASRRFAAAFAAGTDMSVRSLRLDPEQPD